MKITTKEEAILNGSKKYFTGKECRKGHLSERYVLGDRCIQCAKEWTKQYMVEYRKTDKYLDYQRNYQRKYQKNLRLQKVEAAKEKGM